MAEKPKPQSWWHTLPGIFTAVAGIITAVTGSIIALNQVGYFQDAKEKPITTATPASVPVIRSEQLGITATAEVIAKSPSQMPDTEAKTVGQQKRINLLTAENGVQLLVASSDDWAATIDGKEDWSQISYGLGKEAVYGFKDEQAATFDTFTMLISETGDYNVKEFELLVGNDSPTGNFESISKFQTQNVKLFKTPYQVFKFPAITSKYLKIKLLATFGSTHPGVHEFQLFGSLK